MIVVVQETSAVETQDQYTLCCL